MIYIFNNCNKVLSKRKEATFGADFIACFPTETDEMFKDTLDLVDECHLTHLHVIPYSVRENTPAARMPQVDKSVINLFSSVTSNSNIDLEGNNPPGISGSAVKR